MIRFLFSIRDYSYTVISCLSPVDGLNKTFLQLSIYFMLLMRLSLSIFSNEERSAICKGYRLCTGGFASEIFVLLDYRCLESFFESKSLLLEAVLGIAY